MRLYNKFLFAFMGGLLLIGCDAENFDQDVDPVGSTDSYPTPSFELQGSPEFTANEGDATIYTWKVILDKPIAYDTKFGFAVVEGTATIDKDFTVSSTTIPAYTTTGSISVTVNADTTPEETETVKLKVVSGPGNDDLVQYLTHPNTVYPVVDLTIENYISDDITATFDWFAASTAFTYLGTNYSVCGFGVDVDVYVTTNPVFSWDDVSNVYGYDAASSDCPEDFDVKQFSDGTYYFWADLYGNSNAGLWDADNPFPITTTISQTGVKENVFVQDPSDAFTTKMTSTGDTNPLLMKVVINGDEWTATAN